MVTGGASAAWGSDAVTGVVNIVINKNFAGLKASIDLQDTGQDNRRAYGFTVTNGFDILGGRSHIEWVVTYNNSPSTVFESSAHWFNNPGVIANPLYVAGNHNVPQMIHVNNGGQRDGPAATSAAVRWQASASAPAAASSSYNVPTCTYYANAITAALHRQPPPVRACRSAMAVRPTSTTSAAKYRPSCPSRSLRASNT